MEHGNTRRQFVRPGLAIIFIVLGIDGWAARLGLSYVFEGIALVAMTILLGQSINVILSTPGSVNDASLSTLPERLGLRTGPGVPTVLAAVTVTAFLIVLSMCHLADPFFIAEDPVHTDYYGFPLRCVWTGGDVLIDFVRLAANIALGLALIFGVAIELENYRSCRQAKEQYQANNRQPQCAASRTAAPSNRACR